jgi:hypothetical protein
MGWPATASPQVAKPTTAQKEAHFGILFDCSFTILFVSIAGITPPRHCFGPCNVAKPP